MPVMKLTQSMIDQGLDVPGGQRRIEYCDAEVPGLLLEVRATSPAEGTYFLRFKKEGKTAYQRLGHKSDTTLFDARQAAKKFKAELQLGVAKTVAKSDPSSPTLTEFWTDSYEPYVRPRLRSYGKLKQMFTARVEPRFGNVRLNELRRQDIQTFHADVAASGASQATADHHLKLIRQMLNAAVEWGVLSVNPVGKVKLFNPDNRKVDDYMSPEELERFLTVLRTHKNRPVCNLALFLLATGARLQEALKARWPHVNRATRTWHVPPEHSKSKRIRTIVLNDAAIEILDTLGTEGKGAELFVSPKTGKPLRWVHGSFDRLTALAGLPNITPHSLRRNFALHTLDAGASIYAVSKLLGHASVDVTVARYASMSNAALFEAANGASKFLQRPKVEPGDGERPAAA